MKNKIFTVLKKEMRAAFRDKKSLSMMLVIPIMIPFLIIGMSALFDMEVNKTENDYNKIGFAYELTDAEKEIIKDLEIEATIDSFENLKTMYEDNKIDIYVSKKDNTYIIHGNNDADTSYASLLVEKYFNSYKMYLQNEYLLSQNVNSEDVMNIISLEYKIEEEENFYADYIVTYAFMFIIMAITVSATYPATDTTAGEKERGTLETLLTFPIKSKDIILGKYLSIVVSSIITGSVSLILMIISLIYANNNFTIYEGLNLGLNFVEILFVILVIIIYSLLISALCIMIASKSKTFKEAQSALTPLTFISFFPSMIAFMVEIENSLLFSSIPFLNFTLLFSDLVADQINILNVIAMILSTFVVVFIVIKIIIKQYKTEEILFNN